jgi:TonB family protein
MTHLFVLWFALFAAQATTPATPPPSEPPTTQPTQQPAPAAPSTASPDQAAPAKPPCPNPDASGNYHVGCGVTPPKLLYQSEPQFSEIARQQGIEGIATLSFIVDAQGNPENVHVIKSIADTVDSKHRAAALTLDQVAIDTVKNYKFKPATKDGKPVPIILNVSIKFEAY